MGKKGELTSLFSEFKRLDNDKKKPVGKLLNELKLLAQSKIDDFKKSFKSKNRLKCAPPAPACGLYLIKVTY